MNLRLSGRLVLSVILVAAAIAEWTHYSRPRIEGSLVYLPHACTQIEADNRGDGREVWIRLYLGQTYMNEKPISRDQIANTTGALMETRAEPVVFLLADGQLSYGEVVYWVSRMEARSPGLAMFLVTRSQDEASGPHHCIVLGSNQLER